MRITKWTGTFITVLLVLGFALPGPVFAGSEPAAPATAVSTGAQPISQSELQEMRQLLRSQAITVRLRHPQQTFLRSMLCSRA